MPGFGLLPPGLGPFVVKPPECHRHPRFPVCPRLHGIAMEDETVHPCTKGPVPLGFQQCGMCQPVFAGICRKGLGWYNLMSVNVSRRNHRRSPGVRAENSLETIPGFTNSLVFPAVPKFCLRQIGLPANPDFIKRRIIDGLHRKLNPLFVGKFTQMTGVIRSDQL